MAPAVLRLVIDDLQRIEAEAVHMGAETCCPNSCACPKCEILFLAREALVALNAK